MALSKEQRKRVEALIDDEYVDEDDDEVATAAAFASLLDADSDPEELHVFAKEFNWDCGCSEMAAVIAHPLCDLGTALLIYWLGAPGYYLQYGGRSDVPEEEQETFDLLQEIERKVLAGGFRARSQPFNPRNDDRHDFTTAYDDIVESARARGTLTRSIPSEMYQAIAAD